MNNQDTNTSILRCAALSCAAIALLLALPAAGAEIYRGAATVGSWQPVLHAHGGQRSTGLQLGERLRTAAPGAADASAQEWTLR